MTFDRVLSRHPVDSNLGNADSRDYIARRTERCSGWRVATQAILVLDFPVLLSGVH